MSKPWPRVILHADMDAFFAAVEQLDRPELRGKPLLVGFPGRRSVVSTASYEARPYGVGSAMPMARARKLCPQAIVVPPRFERYAEVSAIVRGVFRRFSPAVEPLSLDEAFLDMTGAAELFGPPASMGRRLKEEVRAATGGLTVSVGLATTKYVAKVASDFRKPDGLTIVEPDQVRAFLQPLPIRRLWGVGPRAAAELERLGLHTIGDVAAASPALLAAELGALGEHAYALARGDDPREVEPDHETKSVGHEETLAEDITTAHEAKPLLLRSADRVAERLRADGAQARGVRVKLKTASFRLLTRQRRLDAPTSSAQPLYAAALALLDEFPWSEPLRLVGLAAYDLTSATDPVQGDLFLQPERQRQARLDRALDAVHARFGGEALRRASDLAPPDPGADDPWRPPAPAWPRRPR